MATLGERLSEARKNFGIDIRSAAEATKIRSDFLIALEENTPEQIDLANVYKVGFLRIYAKYLKLDADRLVAEFKSDFVLRGSLKKGMRRDEAGTVDKATPENTSVFSQGRTEPLSVESLFRRGGHRLVIAIAIVAVVIVAAIFGLVKAFGGDDALSSVVVEAPTPETQPYEFQLISKVPQIVTVTDRYGVEGAERAVLVNAQAIPANRPMTYVGRGVLEIRDSGGSNLEIRFPAREALLSSKNARDVVKFKESDNQNPAFRNNGNWWTADPYRETR